MNEKKDDSEGRNDNLSDTAELLESLFKDTKDSRIKLVRRKTRPKSRMKKRVVSKQRKESVKKTSKTRVLKQGRPSEPERSTGPTKEKTRFRKASLPGSRISKDSKIKPSSIQTATADTRPTSTIGKDDSEKTSKTDVLKKERGPSITSAGRTEDKAAIPETAEIVFDRVDQKGDASADHEGLAEADEEITEVLDKSALSSMISSLEASGEEVQRTPSAEEGSIPEDEQKDVETLVEPGAPEERPLVFSRIGGLGKEEPLAQENRTASSSIGSEDSLLKVREHEAYSESTPKEKPISEDKEEGEDSLIVADEGELLHEQAAEEGAVAEEERPSDPAGIVGAAEEESLFHEEPAASSSIAIEDSLLEASEHEAYPESAFEEGPISEDKEDGFEGIQEAVGPEKESPLAPVSAEPRKEKPQFQEQPAPTLGPLDDSLARTGEQDFHHRQAAEDEPMLTDGGGDIQKALRLEKSKEDEPADLEEHIEELMGEIHSLRSSVRRAMLVKVVLPLVLFAILAVILSIWLMPLDSSKREEAQEMAKKEMAETPEPKEQDIAPETSMKMAAVAEPDVEHSDAAEKAEAVQKEEPVSNTFSIYLGSYGVLKEAEKAIAEYKTKNIFPYLSEVYLGDKVEFYRIFAGRFEEKAQAEEYIKSEGLKGAKVWKME